MGVTKFGFEIQYEQLKPNYEVFLQGFPAAMVTFYVTKMTKSFSAIINVWYGTTRLLLSDKVL